MSTGFVADSSVAVAWVVHTQSSPATNKLLSDVEAGTSFLVPALWMLEVANSLLILRRRRRIDSWEYERARQYLTDSNPVIDDKGPQLALGAVSELAEKQELSVYDAIYLELALRRGLPLATRDSALNKAAKRSGVPTLLYAG
jgi:predicted nucleic acid-binding protein